MNLNLEPSDVRYNPHRPCSIHISWELSPLDKVTSTDAFLHFLTCCKVVLYRKNGAHNHEHITQQTTISTISSMKLILAAQVRGAGFNSQWLPTFNTSISVAKLVTEESSSCQLLLFMWSFQFHQHTYLISVCNNIRFYLFHPLHQDVASSSYL